MALRINLERACGGLWLRGTARLRLFLAVSQLERVIIYHRAKRMASKLPTWVARTPGIGGVTMDDGR